MINIKALTFYILGTTIRESMIFIFLNLAYFTKCNGFQFIWCKTRISFSWGSSTISQHIWTTFCLGSHQNDGHLIWVYTIGIANWTAIYGGRRYRKHSIWWINILGILAGIQWLDEMKHSFQISEELPDYYQQWFK